MVELSFITAEQAARILHISKSHAYRLIRAMNKELKAEGYFVIAGKVPVDFFKKHFYIKSNLSLEQQQS